MEVKKNVTVEFNKEEREIFQKCYKLVDKLLECMYDNDCSSITYDEDYDCRYTTYGLTELELVSEILYRLDDMTDLI